MIFTTAQTPDNTTLVATVATWKGLMGIRAMPRGRAISHAVRDGEVMSEARWTDTTGIIHRAIEGLEDAAVVRVRLSADIAAAVVGMQAQP